MLDQAGDTPTAPPPESFLIALRGGGTLRLSNVALTDLSGHAARRLIADEVDTASDGPGLRAEPNSTGGFHVGRGSLVQVDGGEPITWARFAEDHAHLGKGELRIIFADLAASGVHASEGSGGAAGLWVYLLSAVSQPEASPPRVAADAELARLDAAYCQLAQARRRYAADTACNAWSLEQAAKDVVRAAEAVTQAFARRSELA